MKKLLAVLICLMISLTLLAFVSCGETEGGDGSSSAESSEKSDAAASDGSGDESTEDSSGDSATDSSGGTDDSTGTSTDNSTDVSTDASIDNGGNDDEKKDKVTVQFRGNAGYGVTLEGNATVEIEKGTSLDPSLAPVAKRNGYKFDAWSYDTRGVDLWSPSDTFDIDTVLYAVWSVDDSGAGEQVTVTFTCMGGTYQSGDKEIKINTGSAISKEQMPVYTRNGYVIRWSYDMFGDEPWRGSDTFDKNTELYATWIKEDDYFDVINAYLFTLSSVQMTDSMTFKGADATLLVTVTKYDGQNVYSSVTMVGGSGLAGSKEEYWYVDGVFYSAYGGEKIKTELSYDEYKETIRAPFVGEDRIFQIKKDAVTSITKNGNEYVIEVDGEKYTQGLQIGADIFYESFTMTVTFDESGEISKISTDYAYRVSDGTVMECISVSEFSAVGETTVEAPADADEFVSR